MNQAIPNMPSRKQRPIRPPNAMPGLDRLTLAIDNACDAGDVQELNHLAAECDDAMGTAPSASRVLLLYYQSNALGGIASANHRHADYAWSWNQTERVRCVLLLRCALKEPAFQALDAVRRYQILTNLANYLNNFGRPIAANEQWLRILDETPNFAMTLANRANALYHYALQVYDPGHRLMLFWAARQLFDHALSKEAIWDSSDTPDPALAHTWTIMRHQIQDRLSGSGFDEDFDTDQWSLGRSPEEKAYRHWCLRNRLFLNPLSDAFLTTVSARDVLHLPSHRYAVTEAPRFPDYFNLLKQEYVSARYRLYRSTYEPDPHFVMKDVLMLPGAHDQVLGHSTEDLRSAFRSAYAIFDKIGIFLNDYYDVGFKPRDVTFRRIWSQRRGTAFSLHEPFQDRKNWLLRGLYFVSKDLFDPLFTDTAAPDAKDLAVLRNAAEHRFLSLQHQRQDENTPAHSFVSVQDFERKTLRLLKMAREALIYLSLAMHHEERQRTAQASE